jgi:glycosyltransferase involved in cell wall biosynthesis
MKILYFHQHFTTRAGASGTRSYEMATRLIEKGHEVTMVCGAMKASSTGLTQEYVDGKREGVVDGIHIIEFGLPYSNNQSFKDRIKVFAQYSVKSAQLALKAEYDLLFATSSPLTAAIPGIVMKWFRRAKRPFVFEIRDPWPEGPREMGVIKNPVALLLLEWLETWAYKAADFHIALSPGMVDAFLRKNVRQETVTMIPNGCDNNFFQPEKEKSFVIPGIAPEDTVAVFMGTHGYANGLDSVVDAAEVLKERGRKGIKIALIGDGAKKKSLVAAVEERKLADYVVFHDPIPKDKLKALIPRADIGLMLLSNVKTFYYASSPNKFFDFLSCGLPVVVNHPGWVKDLISENHCGVSAEPESAVALADAIEQMANLSPEERWQMGERARALAEREFDRDLLAERFIEVIERAYSTWNKK